jgi:MFS transporter, FSR family, fosmidomycin resistance protein
MKSNLLFLTILHIINDGYHASFLLLLPFISQDLRLSLTQVGVLGGIVGVSSIFLAVPAGHIAAKFGGFRTLLFALLIYAVGFLITGIAPHFYFLMLTFLIGSVGFGIFHPIGFALVSRWSDKSTRGRQMGNFTAWGDVGRIGIAAAVTFIIAYIGWRSTSLLYASIAAVIFFYFYFFHLPKGDFIEEKHASQTPVSYKQLLSARPFLLASLTGVLDSFASSSLFVFLPFLLVAKGIDATILGSFTAAFFIGNFAGKTLLGRLVDKFGNIRVFVLSEIFMALLIIALAYTNAFIIIIAVSIVLGALTKGTVPVAQTLVSEAIEGHGSHEKAFGIHSLFVNIATTVAPILLGFISDRYGIINAFFVCAGIALLAILPASAYHLTSSHRIKTRS